MQDQFLFHSWTPKVVFSLMAPPLVKILLLAFIRWNKNRSYTVKVKYPLYIKVYILDNIFSLIYISIRIIPSNWYLKYNFLGPRNLLWDTIRTNLDFWLYVHFMKEVLNDKYKSHQNTLLSADSLNTSGEISLLFKLYVMEIFRLSRSVIPSVRPQLHQRSVISFKPRLSDLA